MTGGKAGAEYWEDKTNTLKIKDVTMYQVVDLRLTSPILALHVCFCKGSNKYLENTM